MLLCCPPVDLILLCCPPGLALQLLVDLAGQKLEVATSTLAKITAEKQEVEKRFTDDSEASRLAEKKAGIVRESLETLKLEIEDVKNAFRCHRDLAGQKLESATSALAKISAEKEEVEKY